MISPYSPAKPPRVTIGLPVYNGEKTLAAALDSLLLQTFDAFSIIISDNGSTDATPEICKRYASAHPNITWHRQPLKLSILKNFHFCLSAARTEYFMWLAADDEIAAEFIARHSAFLDANPDYVSSQSRVLFHTDFVPVCFSNGTFALKGNMRQNVASYLATASDNCRFYGLFRTRALQEAYLALDLFSFDWVIMVQTLLHGKQNEIDDVLMLRDATPPENYQLSFDAGQPSRLERIFPLTTTSRYLLQHHAIMKHPHVFYTLMKLNVLMAKYYVGYRIFTRAKTRRDNPKNHGSFRSLIDFLVMTLINPDAAGVDIKFTALRARLRRYLKTPSSHPDSIQSRDRGWLPLPDCSAAVPDVSLVLIVKDHLRDTLRLLSTISEAVLPQTYDVILVDCGSRDATPLLFRNKRDLSYVRLGSTASFSDVAHAVVQKARSKTVLFIEPGTQLYEGALRHLARSVGETDMCGPVCLCTQCAVADDPSREWHGLFGVSTVTLRHHLATLADLPFGAALAQSIVQQGGCVLRCPEAVISRLPLSTAGSVYEPHKSISASA